MGKEYQFAVTKCTRCGQRLSGKHVELAGMKGPLPMGRCPKCGIAYPLVEIEPEPVVEPPAPEPEPEPEPEEPPALEPK